MAKKLVIGNWKMNFTQAQALSTVDSMIPKLGALANVEVGVCPPYMSIAKVREALKKTNIGLGAQDVFWKDSGAFTGRVSAHMLSDAGVNLCLVGHSETRGRFGKLEIPEGTVSYFAETDETVNLKIKALLYHNITPVLCVGETLSEREEHATDKIIEGQLRAALDGVEPAEFLSGVVAYEPVWAIGTGKVCDPSEASRVCSRIKEVIASCLDEEAGQSVRVLYGGSVKASNSSELFHCPGIDGGLVGGASLDPDEFCRIAMSAAR